MDWKPIETAPMDGRSVLLYEGGMPPAIVAGEWAEYRSKPSCWQLSHGCWSDESTSVNPTHWMPLPEPPK